MDPVTAATSGIVGSILAWFGVKKLRQGDRIGESQADAIISMNGAAKTIIEELEKRYKALVEEVKSLNAKITELAAEHKTCREENSRLNEKLLELSDRVTLIAGTDMLDRGQL